MSTNSTMSRTNLPVATNDAGNVHRFIRESYDLDQILKVSPVPSRPHSVLVTSRGTFLLRALLYPFQLRRVFYDAAFTDYLSEKRYPARRVLKTRDGQLFVKVNEHAFCLVEYVEGAFRPSSTTPLSEPQLVAAGVRLAELHRLASFYEGPSEHRLPFRGSRSLELFGKIASVIRTKRIRDHFDELALVAIEKKSEEVIKRPFEHQEFMYGSTIVNHGDYHSGNIVFDDANRVVAVLDFEYCTKMPRTWDLAWAMSWLGRRRFTEAFNGALDLKRVKTFLSSYERCLPLSQGERLGLIDLFVSSCYHTTFLLEHLYLKGRWDCQIEKPHDLEEWFWCMDHQDELEDVILSIY